jgi:hypothetical protein
MMAEYWGKSAAAFQSHLESQVKKNQKARSLLDQMPIKQPEPRCICCGAPRSKIQHG